MAATAMHPDLENTGDGDPLVEHDVWNGRPPPHGKWFRAGVAMSVLGAVLLLGGLGSQMPKVQTGPDVNKSSISLESEAAAEPCSWHPYACAVKQACKGDLEAMCKKTDLDNLGRSFLSAVGCLNSKSSQLTAKCREVAFGGTAGEPNKLIFHVMSNTVPGNRNGGQVKYESTLGYVKAPLIYNHVDHPDIFKTFFLYTPCKTQPAPRGLLFFHGGGPQPSVLWGMHEYFADQTGADYIDYVAENYDLVSVDNRGMGFSAPELLYEGYTFPESVEGSTLKSLLEYQGALNKEKGNFFGDTATYQLPGDCPGTVRNASCRALRDTPPFDSFKDPADLSDLAAVSSWLDMKAKIHTACSKKFDRISGEKSSLTGTAKSYNVLQYLGTEALAHDIEWFRLALGGPKITIWGASYGSRVAAAYISVFPSRVEKALVNGIMAPEPDSLNYGLIAAKNTGELMGFILTQCVQAGPACSTNPFTKGQGEEMYFEGDISAAVKELYRRSKEGGKWYKEQCKVPFGLSATKMSVVLQRYLTTDNDEKSYLGFGPRAMQNKTWPWSFSALPGLVFFLLQNPCLLNNLGEQGAAATSGFDNDGMWVYGLIPALDMVGRNAKEQIAKVVTDTASNTVMNPGLNMFLAYATYPYGWPQFPTPIGFSNPDVEVLIVNPLYDERTGVRAADQFKLNFPKSRMVTSVSGGHLVQEDRGPEGFQIARAWLLKDIEPPSRFYTSDVAERVNINFAVGAGAVVTNAKGLIAKMTAGQGR